MIYLYSRIVKIDRFFPSSKTCSNCGYINELLKLSDRQWQCPRCKIKHDRDYNASLNILNQGCNLLNDDNNLTAGMAGLATCPDVRPIVSNNDGQLVGVETLSFREG